VTVCDLIEQQGNKKQFHVAPTFYSTLKAIENIV